MAKKQYHVIQYLRDKILSATNHWRDHWQVFSDWCNEKHTGLLWVLLIVYRISVDVLYIFAVSPQYAYSSLPLAPNSIKYLLSWIFMIIIFYAMPKSEYRIVSLCLHIQFAVTIIPLLSYYSLNDQSTKYMIMVIVVVLLQSWILRDTPKPRPAVRLVHMKPFVEVFAPVFIIASISMAFFWNGFHGLQAFDLKFLYSIRENASYPPILPYFLSWLPTTILPFFTADSLHRRRYFRTFVYIVLSLVLYMIMGNKVIYLSILVTLGVYFIQRLRMPIKLLYISLSFLAILITTLYLIEKIAPETSIATTLNAIFGIRFLFIPAQIKFLYFDTFTEFPKSFFADGQIGRFFGLTYPFQGSLGQTAFAFQGGKMFASNSNTGYLGDSYAQFGFIGMILMGLLLACLIRFFERSVSSDSQIVFATALAMQMIVLNDGALLSQLLTGGMWLLIVLAMVYAKPNQEHVLQSVQTDIGGKILDR